ncbi:flagellar biosynthesis repressor FlbT [Methylobacterium sp. J-068]|uniref:flagellar biosynthesis repressor FlbT n=1 Tax=Methylobacterium sp. J-068 TaxID=2836649 RepID=UPI001FBB0C57|nr:flagellar biosynthesis repressor FlbT [Methylobacterium sp. J-068]
MNGAVLRVDRKVSLELLNDASFLLETHVLQAEAATTPLRQLYFAAQTILIEPANAERARDLFRTLRDGILAAVADPAIRDGVAEAGQLVEAGRLIEALKLIRGLYRTEAALLAAPAGEAAPIPASESRTSPIQPAPAPSHEEARR